MRRLLLTTALAVGVFALASTDARSQCHSCNSGGVSGYTFTFGWLSGGGPISVPGYGTRTGPGYCFTPGWSPDYPRPQMYGGMRAAGYVFNPTPLYPGRIPYAGGYDAVGLIPAPPPQRQIERRPGDRQIEKGKDDRTLEKGKDDRILEKGKGDRILEKDKGDRILEKSKGDKKIEKGPPPVEKSIEKKEDEKSIEKKGDEKTIEKKSDEKTIEGKKP